MHSPRSRRILVVEDDEDVRTLVTEVLSELNYAVVAASNAVAALEILRGDPGIDLLFTDVVMPGGMSGTALAASASQLRPGLKILLTSGYLGHPPARAPLKLSGEEFLPKPYRPAKLAEKIKALLGD